MYTMKQRPNPNAIQPSEHVHANSCYRGAPCLFAEPSPVKREDNWDYYDTRKRQYIHLACSIHQKYWTDSLLEIENADKWHTPVGRESYETRDLQLADTNGTWFTLSDDPEWYQWNPDYDESMTCPRCELVCEVRDDKRYLNEEATCPFPDPAPVLKYTSVQDYDRPCQDFLHPLLLENIDSVNRKRRKAAFHHLAGYLRQPKWIHALINTGQSITEVWERNYQPAMCYYSSFDTILKYVRSRPRELQKNRQWVRHLWNNARKSPSYRELRRFGSYFEDEIHDTLERIVMGEA